MEIIDRTGLSQGLIFKGGTCASMLGYLDRFSVDLDFDVMANVNEAALRDEFCEVFDQLGLGITKEHEQFLFFQIRYPNDPGKRNTIKISANNLPVKANQYKAQYLSEIGPPDELPDHRDYVCE